MAGSGQAGGAARVEVFAYPGPAEDAGWAVAEGWLGADPAEKRAREPQEPKHPAADEAELRAEFDRRLSEEARRSFEAGRERGRLEGQKSEMEAQATARAEADQRRVRQAMELVESFAAERDRYLRTVEREVVELALAIAARILRREAQMDPLLLTGAVRVALGQLTGATEVRLRVPAGELDLWTESMALVPNLGVRPMVVAGRGDAGGRVPDRDGTGHGGPGDSAAVERD